jgi:hypothetical protein
MKPEHHSFLVSTGVLSQLEVDARVNVSARMRRHQVQSRSGGREEDRETLIDFLVNTSVIPGRRASAS